MLDQPPPPRAKEGIPVLIWILVGVGGLSFVVFFLGIIAAIALPSFLNQANKARQAEAKQYLGAILRSEQAYFLDNNRFTQSLSDLAVTLPEASTNYQYVLKPSKTAFHITATPTKSGLKSYSGVVFAFPQNQEITKARLCESTETSMVAPQMPIALPSSPAKIACPEGSQPVL